MQTEQWLSIPMVPVTTSSFKAKFWDSCEKCVVDHSPSRTTHPAPSFHYSPLFHHGRAKQKGLHLLRDLFWSYKRGTLPQLFPVYMPSLCQEKGLRVWMICLGRIFHPCQPRNRWRHLWKGSLKQQNLINKTVLISQ